MTLGNGSVAHVLGRGRIDFKMTSGKVLTLSDVQHVHDIRKNLISGFLLIQSGFKIVLESNCLVISKENLFVGKGFVSGGLFKLNVCEPPDLSSNEISDISFSSSTVLSVESCDVWHGRLGHVNFGTIRRLMNLELIPRFKIDQGSKCQICV